MRTGLGIQRRMAAISGHVPEDLELRQRIAREVGLGFRLPSFAPAEQSALELAEAIACG